MSGKGRGLRLSQLPKRSKFVKVGGFTAAQLAEHAAIMGYGEPAKPHKSTPRKPAAPIPSESKYRNRRTVVDGISFHSAKEGRRYQELKLLQKAGQIADLHLQPRIKLQSGGVHICDYVADFFYTERRPEWINNGNDPEYYSAPVYEDVKGTRTPIYKLKKRLVKALTGIDILET